MVGGCGLLKPEKEKESRFFFQEVIVIHHNNLWIYTILVLGLTHTKNMADTFKIEGQNNVKSKEFKLHKIIKRLK